MARTTLPPFAPTSVLEGGKDPDTDARFPSRLSTTGEQRAEAVRHALAWMVEHRIWTVDLPVHWTRHAPTTLTVKGHAEHLRGELLPVEDDVTETDGDGRAIVTTAAERHVTLERELSEIWANPLE